MKTNEILTILVLAVCAIACHPGIINAAPLGTTFTYQGRLLDNNEPATGIYDLQCKLFDSKDPNAIQIGPTLTFEDGQGDDGYFTITLDFGVGVFDGNKRYLELAFRPYDSNDPCDFVVLEPRTEITPAPYAMYAANALTDNDWYVDGNTMSANPDSVGIGTSAPVGKLQVTGDEVRIGTGTPDYATGSGDLYVHNTLEVDGHVYGDNLPGCKYSLNKTLENVPSSWTNVASVDLALSAPGYVMLTFSGYVNVDTAGDWVEVAIGTSSTGHTTLQRCETQAAGDYIPFSVQYVYSVSPAGTYTYYYYANARSSAATPDIYDATLTALYVPKSY